MIPSLPRQLWECLSPGRPWERSFWKDLQPCLVSERLLSGGSGPGQPGVAEAGERRPVYESWSGKMLEAQGWKKCSGGGWQNSRWPSHSWSARLAVWTTIRSAYSPGLRVRAAAAATAQSRASPRAAQVRASCPRAQKLFWGLRAPGRPLALDSAGAARSSLGPRTRAAAGPGPTMRRRRHPEQSAVPPGRAAGGGAS